MAYSQDVRDSLRRLYIEGLPLKTAATRLSVNYQTARTWQQSAEAKGDSWDNARTAYRVSDKGVDDLSRQMVEDFARQVVTTTREVESAQGLSAAEKVSLLSSLADAYSKFSKSFAKINPQYSGLSVALDTLKVIVEHLKTADSAALKALHPHLDTIGAALGKRYG